MLCTKSDITSKQKQLPETLRQEKEVLSPKFNWKIPQIFHLLQLFKTIIWVLTICTKIVRILGLAGTLQNI